MKRFLLALTILGLALTPMMASAAPVKHAARKQHHRKHVAKHAVRHHAVRKHAA